MTLHVVIRPPLPVTRLSSVLSADNGNQDDNWEWEAEGGMSTCKCQLESHSANSVQNQTWKPEYYSRSCQLGYLNCSPHPSMLNIGFCIHCVM